MFICQEEINEIFLSFMHELGINKDIVSVICPTLLCKHAGRNSVDLFCASRDSLEFIEETLPSEKNSLVLVGTYSGRVKDRSFVPSISLAHLLLKYMDELIENLVIIKKGKETVFTYGKPLSREEYDLKSTNRKIYLVLTYKKEPIGWGVISKEKLIPIVDVGWFIRAGY